MAQHTRMAYGLCCDGCSCILFSDLPTTVATCDCGNVTLTGGPFHLHVEYSTYLPIADGKVRICEASGSTEAIESIQWILELPQEQRDRVRDAMMACWRESF